MELPSDFVGMVYDVFDPGGKWKQRLRGELVGAKVLLRQVKPTAIKPKAAAAKPKPTVAKSKPAAKKTGTAPNKLKADGSRKPTTKAVKPKKPISKR